MKSERGEKKGVFVGKENYLDNHPATDSYMREEGKPFVFRWRRFNQ